MDTQSQSPFIAICTKPRETIRKIVETNPTKSIILLAILAGIGRALDGMPAQNEGSPIPLAVLLAGNILAGSIGGIVSLYIGSALYQWVGSLQGGQATRKEVRAAIGWSFMPMIWAMLLWIPKLLIFGTDAFTGITARIETDPFLSMSWWGFAAAERIAIVWTFFLLSGTLSEVHKFSVWKALTTILFGSLVIAPFVVIAAFAIVYFLSIPSPIIGW